MISNWKINSNECVPEDLSIFRNKFSSNELNILQEYILNRQSRKAQPNSFPNGWLSSQKLSAYFCKRYKHEVDSKSESMAMDIDEVERFESNTEPIQIEALDLSVKSFCQSDDIFDNSRPKEYQSNPDINSNHVENPRIFHNYHENVPSDIDESDFAKVLEDLKTDLEKERSTRESSDLSITKESKDLKLKDENGNEVSVSLNIMDKDNETSMMLSTDINSSFEYNPPDFQGKHLILIHLIPNSISNQVKIQTFLLKKIDKFVAF